jgi:amidase
MDEGGFGYSTNFVQTRTVRDAAAMLDCVAVPQPGDPFIIPKPQEPYAALAARRPRPLRVGLVLDELVGVKVDPEVARAVEETGRALSAMGHEVERATVDMGGAGVLDTTTDLFFFAFDARLEGYAQRSGKKIGPDTLEPVILSLYEYSKSITPRRFMAAWAEANVARRRLGAFFTRYDVWLSPTTSRVAEPWGTYTLSRLGVDARNVAELLYRVPCQFTIPHNIMGTPAVSLPLAMHSTGLPIGVQIAARPAEDHVALQVAAALEEAMPWAERLPPLHVSKLVE